MDVHVFLIGRTTPVTIIHTKDNAAALAAVDKIAEAFNNCELMRVDKFTLINTERIERIELKERGR